MPLLLPPPLRALQSISNEIDMIRGCDHENVVRYIGRFFVRPLLNVRKPNPVSSFPAAVAESALLEACAYGMRVS